MTIAGCGCVLAPEIVFHDCTSLVDSLRVDVFNSEGLPVFTSLSVQTPSDSYNLPLDDLDRLTDVLRRARTAAAQALGAKGIPT